MHPIYKRLTAFLLVFTLILSNAPITSYAVVSKGEPSDMDSAAGGGDGHSQVGNGGDWGNNGTLNGSNGDISRAGLRISLVDVHDPTKVVSLDTEGNPRVIDIILCSEAKYNETCKSYQGRVPQIFTDIKTQGLNIKSDGSYERINKCYQLFLPDWCENITEKVTSGTATDFEKTMYYSLNMDNMFGGILDDEKRETPKVPEPVVQLRWLYGNNPFQTCGTLLADWLARNKSGDYAELKQEKTVNPQGDTVDIPTSTEAEKQGSNKGISKKPETTTSKPSNNKAQENAIYELEKNYTSAQYRYDTSKPRNLTSQGWINQFNACLSWNRSFKQLCTSYYNLGYITKAQHDSFRARADKLLDVFRDFYLHKLAELSTENAKTQGDKIKNKDRNSNRSRKNPNFAIPQEPTNNRYLLDNSKKNGLLDGLYRLIFNPITAYAATEEEEQEELNKHIGEKLNELLDKNDEAIRSTIGEEASHLSYLLQLTDENGVPLFITNETLENGKVKKIPGTDDYMSVLYPIKDGNVNYRILIEPVDWFTPFDLYGQKVLSPVRYYGTITNIVQAMQLYRYAGGPTVNEQLNGGKSNHLNRNTFNKFSWCALTTGSNEDSAKIEFDNFLFTDPSVISGLGTRIVPNSELFSTSQVTTADNGVKTQIGWGVQVYWPSAKTENTHTWDYDKYPQATPGPAPELTIEQKDNIAKPIKVAKWYYTEDTESNTETVIDVKTQPNSGSPILIENEGTETTDIYWQVVGWATGIEDKMPTDGDLSKTYEDFVNSNHGNYGGTDPVKLSISPQDIDKVLYVKLMQKVIPKRNVDIVKVFEDGSTTTVDIIEQVRFPIEGYDPVDSRGTYIEHMESTEPRKNINTWEDLVDVGLSVTEQPIIKQSETITIYIRYSKDTDIPDDTVYGNKQALVLNEDELSYGYTLKNLSTNGTLIYIREKFNSENHKIQGCGGHRRSHSNGGCAGNHGSSQNKKPEMNDNKYTLSVTSGNNNPNFILDYAQEGAWSITGYMGLAGGNTMSLSPNASFLLYRNKDKDLVTLYPDDANNTAEKQNKLSRLGITQISAVPVTRRVGTTGNNKFFDNLNINFSETAAYDRILTWRWWCSERDYYEQNNVSWNGHEWKSQALPSHSLSDVNSAYTFDNNVVTYYELGQTGTGTTQPANSRAEDFASVFHNNAFVSVQQDGDIKFYPYITMRLYDKSNSVGEAVSVTSTNLSTIGAFTKIESGVWKNGVHDEDSANGNNPAPNVALDSTQWSTHKNSLNFMADNSVDDKKSVLPGGATFDVSMNKVNTDAWHGLDNDKPTSSTKLGYRVWQTCIDDGRTGLLAPGSTAPTVNEAKQKVDELDKSIKDAIPTYGLVQTVASGIVEYDGYLAKYINNSGYSIIEAGGTWNSIPLSSDAKYYLKLINAGAGSSSNFNTTVTNFDLLKGGIKQQKLYTVRSDTLGNVYVLLDGMQIGKITKTQGVADLTKQSSDIKLLEENTKIITNYLNSIDRNIGNNGVGDKWYNEAFDGVNVLYSYLSYDIGFGNSIAQSPGSNGQGTSKRSAVLDTKLTGKLDNKSDLYNFSADTQNEKIRSSMILTGSTESLSAPSGNMGKLNLKNGSSIQVTLGDIRAFAYSKMFFIPNANVSDLN